MHATNFDPQALAQRFRPIYRFHSEEMWYPCHPEDQLRCANLVSVGDGSVVIPALGEGEGSPADQFLCTPKGLAQLKKRGIQLDDATVEALHWVSTASPHYGAISPNASFVLQRADDQFMPPYGWIESVNFQPSNGTWFHRGAPNNPLNWLGGDAATYAPAIVNPPAGVSRGAWQEPITAVWVQNHTVAGVNYVDVIYTVYLGWNGSISILPGQGEHPNDVETIMVRLAADDLNNPVRFFFQQHGGFSWYDPKHVECNGDRIVVYLARESHECYPRPGRFPRLYGAADDLCDAEGVTWDAPAQYTARPQGCDQYGVDTDALRCSLSPGSPNSIVLVPLDDPGPLWQYVWFQFLARRPATMPPGNEDFLHEPFPLSTTKWWPGEGPAGDSLPLSLKAAEASAIGVPPSFFDPAAAYLGTNPLPTCSSAEVLSAPRRFVAPSSPPVEYLSRQQETVSGSEIGGGPAVLAPGASFVDWRGGIGAYLLGSINFHLPGWLANLPDPLVIKNIKAGIITISQFSVGGLHQLQVSPVIPTSATNAHVSATAPELTCTAIVSFSRELQNITVSAVIDTSVLDAMASLITPVAIPACDETQWYVPYLGPLPYSYATQAFATTTQISSGSISELKFTVGDIKVDVGDNPVLDAMLDILLQCFKQALEKDVSDALQKEINMLLVSIYDGTERVA